MPNAKCVEYFNVLIFSAVSSLRTFRALVVPRCDVINHVTERVDDQYRHVTRFFTSGAKLSRGHAHDDVTGSRDLGDNPEGVVPVSRMTFRLVLACLDVVVLLYRLTHVCRVVGRMRDFRSRGHRKYYCDHDDEYRPRAEASRRAELDQVDEALCQLPASPSTCCAETTVLCRLAEVVCRLVRSSYVSKLVLFAALVAVGHVTLQLVPSARSLGHLTPVAGDRAALMGLDADIRALYRRDVMMTSFNDFVVNAMSHLSVITDHIVNGNLSHTLTD